jgi:YesN/AraC family two-component response regulator
MSKTNELQMHWHQDLEIIKVLNGEVAYRINGYPYTVTAGDIIIVNPKQVHTARVLSEGPQLNKVLILSYNLLTNPLVESIQENYLELLTHEKFVFNNHIIKHTHPKINELVDQMILLVDQKEPFFELALISCFYELIHYLFSNQLFFYNLAYQHKHELDSGFIARHVIEYIHGHHMKPLTLDSISKEMTVSKFYLCRLFKKATGTTIANYLIHHRLTVAKRLLIDTKKSISTIGYDVGFNNPSYFVSKFKSLYGLTPKEFRMNHT